MVYLKNKHIRLRALEPEDISLIYKWENDSTLWCVGNTLSPYSIYALKEYIAESRRNIYDTGQLRLIIELVESLQAIGTIDLYDFDPHNRRAGIGILIDPDYQGNGWATEALSLLIDYAFSFFKLHQLYAYVPTGNKPSVHLFLHSGFKQTGILSDWSVSENGYEDVFVMQLINKNN